MKAADVIYLGRLYLLAIPVIAVIICSAIPLSLQGRGFTYVLFFHSLIAGLSLALLHSSTYVFNQIMDVDIDRSHPLKRNRPIASGRVSIREAYTVLIIFQLISLFFAIYVSLSVEPWFIIYYLLIALLGYSFSIRRIKGHYATEITWMTLSRGFLPPIASWTLYGDLHDTHLWILVMFSTAWVFFFNILKDFSDIEADRKHGVKTLPVALGLEKARKYVLLGGFVTGFLALYATLYYRHFWLMLFIIPMIIKLADAPARENNWGWNMFYFGLASQYILAYASVT